MSEKETDPIMSPWKEREEVIMFLPPKVMERLQEQADKTGESIGMICEDLIKETLRIWD